MNSGDITFLMISTALVFFMTPGLALLYGGLARKKNVISMMLQCFIAIGVVTVVWCVCGFTIAYGNDMGGIIGDFSYALMNNVSVDANHMCANVPFILFFCFQLAFAIITPAIIAGAVAERFSFPAYIGLLILWSILVYAPAAHQLWGGGFFSSVLGVKDFAGGIVVHMSAGFSSLAAAIALGARRDLDYRPCNMAYVAIGTGILWAGWFFFNGGSALTADGIAALALSNSLLASATAMLSWMLISYAKTKSVTLLDGLLGGLAGLIVVTPMAGFVQPGIALIVGIFGGLLSYGCVQFRTARGWDDTMDVWALHGMSGLLGILLVGVFADPSLTGGAAGLIYGGGFSLFGSQLLGALISGVYFFVITFVIIKVLMKVAHGRISPELEDEGLDSGYHHENLYN